MRVTGLSEEAMSDIDLKNQLGRLAAIEEIKQLKALYCEYCDHQYNPNGIASLFVEDGIWDGEQFGRYVGREQIKSFFSRVSGEIIFAAHLVLNPIIEIEDASHASGRWRLVMPATVRAEGKNEARWLLGAYDDRYVRVDGRWLFQSLKTHVNFFTAHLGSWAETAVP
jgi:hypothetical protein